MKYGDTISRQAAIDALQNCRKHCIDPFDSYHIDIQDAENQLSKVPTIQPEPKEGEWIPVSERMPEDYVDVLVWFEYFRYGNCNRMCATHGIGNYSKEYNSWTINHETGWKDLHVFAWMPLPVPYQKGAKD